MFGKDKQADNYKGHPYDVKYCKNLTKQHYPKDCSRERLSKGRVEAVETGIYLNPREKRK